jgi:kinesin family protein 2/24
LQLLGNDVSDLLNNNQPVLVGETKFGQVGVEGAMLVDIDSPQTFYDLNKKAASCRTTTSTFKNDTSSRSHALTHITIENTKFPSLEPGELFIIDLAGSESSADMQFHDKDLIKQTQHINTSLMALKECIRNRALAAINPDNIPHIPYRNSKLTLMLKDSFELESTKRSKTLIIANVSSSIADLGMTKNTLRFIVPIKVGSTLKKSQSHLEPNSENPITWTNEMLREYIRTQSRGKLDCDQFCPFESGKQLLALPEQVLIQRMRDQGMALGAAKGLYDAFW